MRQGKFCPKCGKQTDKLYEGLCSDCFFKKIELPESIPEKLLVGTCKVCGKVFIKEKKFEDVQNAIEFFLQKILNLKEIKSATYRISGSTLFLTVNMDLHDIEKEIEKPVHIVNKAITCSFCNLQKSNYYNVTIQVRVPKEMREKVVGEIEKQIQKLNATDNYSFISGIQTLKEGVDIFIGSKGAAERAVRYLQRKYNAEMKFSRKLYGLIEGKKSYRDTILVSISD